MAYPIEIEPVPTVTPMGAPGARMSISASPIGEVGQMMGKAYGAFGGGIEKAAETGLEYQMQQQEMQDKLHAAETHSWLSDGMSENSGEFLTLTGKNASSALKMYKQKNQDLVDQAIANAPSQYEKNLVAQEARRMLDYQNEMFERHAAGQMHTYNLETSKTNEASSGNLAVNAARGGSGVGAQDNLDKVYLEGLNQGELQYGLVPGSKEIEEFGKQKRGAYSEQVVETLYRHFGADAAQEFFDKEKDKIDSGSANKIEKFLHNSNLEIEAQTKLTSRINNAITDINNSATVKSAATDVGTKAGVNLDALRKVPAHETDTGAPGIYIHPVDRPLPTPPPRPRAETPGTGGTISGTGEVNDAIRATAPTAGMSEPYWKAIAHIESSLDPASNRNQYTQYKGLFQIGTRGNNEWGRVGRGDVYNARDNAEAAAEIASQNNTWFEQRFGRKPDPVETYMMHQQGRGFYQSGTLTNVAGNLPPSLKHRDPGSISPSELEQGWRLRINELAERYGARAEPEREAVARPPAEVPTTTPAPAASVFATGATAVAQPGVTGGVATPSSAGTYPGTFGKAELIDNAKRAIAAGASREQVIARLKQMGIAAEGI